ncbi:MAG: DNA repair protein RecO [Desulfobacteraceae bacterium]|nr:MAG: DNA repair protein RecO [Desulfobacteraceae bacterium]
MSGFSTEAILLKKLEYGDHDLILTFFTRSMGKITAIAKNAKKSVKRFSGSLDLFSVNHIQCTYPKKKKDALLVLSHADLESPFEKIRLDILNTSYACYWLEMVHSWLEEGKPQEPLYDLLLFALDALNSGSMPAPTISILFQIRFMSISGFSPSITECAHCHTGLDEIQGQKVVFDFTEGTLVCPNCNHHPVKKGVTVSKGTLKQLFWINTSDIHRADRIRFSAYAVREGEVLLESFIPFHIGRDLKSLQFLKRIRTP